MKQSRSENRFSPSGILKNPHLSTFEKNKRKAVDDKYQESLDKLLNFYYNMNESRLKQMDPKATPSVESLMALKIQDGLKNHNIMSRLKLNNNSKTYHNEDLSAEAQRAIDLANNLANSPDRDKYKISDLQELHDYGT